MKIRYRYKNLRLQSFAGTNFCDYNCDFYKKLSLGHISLRKRREAWRLTVLSSALPSDGDGEAGFTDTLRPHADYGSRLNPDCLQRLVPMLLRSRHKTQYRQPGFLTPAPCMEFEPPRHSPFFISPRRQSM